MKREPVTPKPGYKSITVKAEIYNYFFNEWLKVKKRNMPQRKASEASQPM